jgi:prepilin-type N-terminal cleavage/methylation domain-containing protein
MRLKVRGFTLMESLIALLLLSMGLLGGGALLLEGLRAHGDALRRMAATRLVQDMADRIRANPGLGGSRAFPGHCPRPVPRSGDTRVDRIRARHRPRHARPLLPPPSMAEPR